MPNENVQFDIDTGTRPVVQSKNSKLTQWVIKYSGGRIKDNKQANYIALGFVVLALAISFFLFFGGKSNPERPFEGGSSPNFSE